MADTAVEESVEEAVPTEVDVDPGSKHVTKDSRVDSQ